MDLDVLGTEVFGGFDALGAVMLLARIHTRIGAQAQFLYKPKSTYIADYSCSES